MRVLTYIFSTQSTAFSQPRKKLLITDRVAKLFWKERAVQPLRLFTDGFVNLFESILRNPSLVLLICS